MTARTLVGLVLLWTGCAATAGEEPETLPPPRVTQTRTHTSRPVDETAWSTTACDRGELAACHAAALDAYYAPPSPDTDARARALFQRGCDGGYAPSCNGLGVLYAAGRGVPKDDVAAAVLYRRACDADGSTGCQHLAAALRGGVGVPKDAAAAARAEARGQCLFDASLAASAPPCPALTAP